MELKDITNEAAMTEVRGGSNTIAQSSYNGPVTGLVGVHGSKFNLSPVSVGSEVLQQNDTLQMAAIDQRRTETLSFSLDQSQLDLGFGGWLRR